MKDNAISGYVNLNSCDAYFNPNKPYKIVLGTMAPSNCADSTGFEEYPNVIADIFAHEFGHGITQIHSSLEYE